MAGGRELGKNDAAGLPVVTPLAGLRTSFTAHQAYDDYSAWAFPQLGTDTELKQMPSITIIATS